jgi:hypothetical protein
VSFKVSKVARPGKALIEMPSKQAKISSKTGGLNLKGSTIQSSIGKDGAKSKDGPKASGIKNDGGKSLMDVQEVEPDIQEVDPTK